MDQFLMDQIICSYEQELEHDLFFNTPVRTNTAKEKPEEAPTCDRCGGPLFYNSCDCTYSEGPYGQGEWSS